MSPVIPGLRDVREAVPGAHPQPGPHLDISLDRMQADTNPRPGLSV